MLQTHYFSCVPALFSALLLAACGEGEVGQPADVQLAALQAPAPTAAPNANTDSTGPQAGAASGSEGASAASSDVNRGKIIIVMEGDSITSPDQIGVYSGAFKAQRPDLDVHIKAVGGSTLQSLFDRRAEVLELRPDIVTVLIGANGFLVEDPQIYAQRVFDYAEPLRASGSRVLIGTILPSDGTVGPARDAERDAARRIYAQILAGAVGEKIDGLFDFGGHNVMGHDDAPADRQLFSDGLHPTWRGTNGLPSGHDYLFEIFNNAIEAELRALEQGHAN